AAPMNHMRVSRNILPIACVVLASAALAACSDDGKNDATSASQATAAATAATIAAASSTAAGTTPRALPSPVATPPATQEGFTLADPALDPLSGGTLDSGRLGGMTYQIEMPGDWNGRLVVYTHGNDIDTVLHV